MFLKNKVQDSKVQGSKVQGSKVQGSGFKKGMKDTSIE